ncbi:MAG: hypothetical protein ACI8X3_001692, partial [Saprospiraceae bacterium]
KIPEIIMNWRGFGVMPSLLNMKICNFLKEKLHFKG